MFAKHPAWLAWALLAPWLTAARAGPYAPAPSPTSPNNGTTAVAANTINEWADKVEGIARGPQDSSEPELGLASFGAPGHALGIANATVFATTPVVSLGDGGSITLSFTRPIRDGTGADFAVFENSLNDSFLELAFVEVSSNGVDFVRFPSFSETPTNVQVNGNEFAGEFGTLDPTNLHNLAGKYRAGYGTPFNLQDLKNLPNAGLLDFNRIPYVRIVDVVGAIDLNYARRDSLNRIINDPWSTPYETAGFDLDAVGVMNSIPEPGTGMLCVLGGLWLGGLRWRRGPIPKAARERTEGLGLRWLASFGSTPAFTLVELLVCIAIVAVLAGLIFAGMTRARNQSASAQCISNLRQLAAANFAYAGEHGGQLVPAQEPANLVRWHGVREEVGKKFDGTRGPLSPYLGKSGLVKLCPALQQALTGGQSFEDGCGGYGYNAAYVGGTPRDFWTPELLGNLTQPARTVMFADCAFARAEGVQEYAFCEPWQQERPPERFRGRLSASVHFRHAGLANVAWCDGHVTSEVPSRLDGGNAYGGDSKKNRLGWFGPSERNGYWRPY